MSEDGSVAVDGLHLPMVCICQAKGMREVESRRLRILQRMHLRTMRDLAEAIVLSLAFDFSCDTEVSVDMWFGIAFRTPLLGEKWDFIACDDPFDGFAAIWEALAERFPNAAHERADKIPFKHAAERVSASLFKRYEETESAYRAHRDAAHAGPNDYPPCEDCDVLLLLACSAQRALADEWGTRCLDACAEAAQAST